MESETVTTDSILTEIRTDTVFVESVPILSYRQDAPFLTMPFTAIVDTIINRDTIYMKYSYPENSSTLSVRTEADSIYTHTVTKTKIKLIENDISWLEVLGYVFVGFLLCGIFLLMRMRL